MSDFAPGYFSPVTPITGAVVGLVKFVVGFLLEVVSIFCGVLALDVDDIGVVEWPLLVLQGGFAVYSVVLVHGVLVLAAFDWAEVVGYWVQVVPGCYFGGSLVLLAFVVGAGGGCCLEGHSSYMLVEKGDGYHGLVVSVVGKLVLKS